jgi:putative nucleotidyltransferase with HDIG domain
MKQFSNAVRVYVFAVASIGAATILHSIVELYADPVSWKWLIFALLTLLSGSATVKLPSVPATISISETFVITSALLFGTAAGTLTVALDALVISFWLARKGHPAYRIAFNIFALPAALWAGSTMYYFIGSIPPLAGYEHPIALSQLLLPLTVFTVVYFSLNSWLLAIAISLERQLSPLDVWRKNFAGLSLNYFGGASIAALLVTYSRDIDFAYLAFILPLLGVLYLTFWVSMRRVEDANAHLSQLNRLYISTIETLAMAIDAKDQITHGHIRRVQHYAVALAKEMGLSDHAQISAIEAASLLHDMGKLAIPEYILNKPGKLTPSEFEKMKLHASVGAELLSAIEFPYPVVPIVRHHHENWDGTGYPDGLKGGDIPIGARILSVVDCFDALTSDRPYRPRLANQEAIRILMERRGTMYDPLVIDTFIAIYHRLEPDNSETQQQDAGTSFSAVTRGATSSTTDRQVADSRLSDVSSSTEEMLVLFDLAQGLTASFDLTDAADIVAKHLRRIIPASTVVLFLHDDEKDDLVAVHAAGDNAARFSGLRIARGQRLTGWVAANRQSIVNSDPILDLGDVARSLRPPLRSCLSTPLVLQNDLVGVLSLYATTREAFSDDHLRVLEIAARQVSQTVQRAVSFERDRAMGHRHRLTGLPNIHQLERVIAAELPGAGHSVGMSLLSVRIQLSSESYAHLVAPAVIQERAVADILRTALRGADMLFHSGTFEFIVLLLNGDMTALKNVARRIAIKMAAAQDAGLIAREVEARIGMSRVPHDGVQVSLLIAAAQQTEISSADLLSSPPTIH